MTHSIKQHYISIILHILLCIAAVTQINTECRITGHGGPKCPFLRLTLIADVQACTTKES